MAKAKAMPNRPSTLLDIVVSDQALPWRKAKKDCWCDESVKNGTDTASLETPITPVANTTTEPPIIGILTQSDEEVQSC